jgi:hypothetical protein
MPDLDLRAITPQAANGVDLAAAEAAQAATNTTNAARIELAQGYDISGGFTGAAQPNETVLSFVAVRPFTIAVSDGVNPAGPHRTAFGTPASAGNGICVFTIYRQAAGAPGRTSIGTLDFGLAGLPAIPAEVAVAAGDWITIVSPAIPDPTLADVSITLMGSLPDVP